MTTRRALLAAAPVAALGLTAQACGPARRRTRYLAPSAVTGADPEPPPAPAPYHDPWVQKGGRLFWGDEFHEPYAPPGYWSFLTPRLRLWVPHWLRLAAHLVPQAEQEAYAAELPNRTDLPPVAVVIHDPGSFSYPVGTDATALAFGTWSVWTDTRPPYGQWDVLRVAWRTDTSRLPLLPALAHEIGHRLTRDPCAGHPQPCG